MIYQRRRGWEIPERNVTPEALFWTRRSALRAGAAVGAAAVFAPALGRADTASLYPAKRDARYPIDRPVTAESVTSHYNNFYEFGMSKDIYDAAQTLKTDPWTVSIEGLVEKPRKVDLADLVKSLPLEERIYRHRCVEAWSMTIPWTGFPLRALIAAAAPLASAKYVRFETFLDAKMAPGQHQFWLPWPYVEGLTMAEAANDLAFVVTGAYGKTLGKSYGAPIRIHIPWKYGFKSIKSIVKIAFVDQRPKSYWESLQSNEYGFWANVNPDVPHPRWSQATEEVIGTGQRRPTLLYNGYGEFVADLYKNLKGERLFT